MISSGSTEKLPERGRTLQVEDLISRSLRLGVVISAGMIFPGFLLVLLAGGTGYPEGSYPTSISAVLSGVVSLKPFAVIELGLLLLIATPIFRVATSLVVFFSAIAIFLMS